MSTQLFTGVPINGGYEKKFEICLGGTLGGALFQWSFILWTFNFACNELYLNYLLEDSCDIFSEAVTSAHLPMTNLECSW